jgi:predicted Zn finger-like uncharacterized protein
MNLTCPSCGATFRVESAQLGPAGRRVRCGDCRHTWHQKAPGEDQALAPEPELPADPAAEQAAAKAAAKPFAPSKVDAGAVESSESAKSARPDPPAEAVPDVAPGIIPGGPGEAASGERVSRRAFSKPARPRPKQSSVSLALGWAIYGVVVIGLGSGFYYGRAPLVAMVPEMTRLYDLIGLKEKVYELGLELRDLKTVTRQIDGGRVVVVEGLVINLSDQARQVPQLYASVTDAEGLELDRWTFRAASASLPPGATTHFETVAKNTPRGGNVFIDFVAEN